MKAPVISIICAMDESGGIGKNDRIPWHIKEDLVRLRDKTKGHSVILGRSSYESMAGYYDKSGRPMPAKEYIVVTTNQDFKSSRNNTFAATSINSALKRAKESAEKEIFVIGGEKIFKQFLPLAGRIYLTRVKGSFDCDTFFPDYSDFKKEISSEESSDNGLSFVFKILERE